MLHLTNLPPNSLLSPRMDQLRLMVNRFKLADDDPPIPLITGHDSANAGLNQDEACSLFVAKLRRINSLQDPERRETLQNLLTYNLQDQRVKAMVTWMQDRED